MSQQANRPQHPAGGRFRFSMASVLLVTAFVAIILAGLRTAATLGGASEEWIAVAGVSGLVVGAIVGVALGVAQPHRLRHVLLGGFLGAISGAAGGAMVAMPRCLPVVVLGAPLLVGFAALVKRLSKPAESE